MKEVLLRNIFDWEVEQFKKQFEREGYKDLIIEDDDCNKYNFKISVEKNEDE